MSMTSRITKFCGNTKSGYKILRTLLSQTILVLLCLASYHHALDGDFVFDDTVAIVRNSDVTKLPTNFSSIFRNDFWGASLLSSDSHKSYRPLTTLMFHWEYAHLGFRAQHMKLVNLLLHCLNTLLVGRLLSKLQFGECKGDNVATLAAALFAIHPVHTEAVSGIVGRAELVFCMLYLAALLTATTHRRSLTPVLVIFLTLAGMLFKESAITIPIACIFLDFSFRRLYLLRWHDQWQQLLSGRNLLYISATLLLSIARLWLQNFESPRFKPMDNPIAFSKDIVTRVLSQHFLYVVNIWILLCPQWLSYDWALGCIRLVTNVCDLRLQAVLAFYSIVIVALINYKRNFAPICGLALLVIPFLPASGIIRVGFVIAERVLYVPSIGFCFLVACGFDYLQSNLEQRWMSSVLKWLLMLTFSCLILRTRQRASEWLTEEQLFASALKVCPNNAKVHYNIARLATDKQEFDKAFGHYQQAIRLYPQYEAALMNLGNLYREVGDLSKAEKYLKASIEALPEFSTAWMNLGIVQSAGRKYEEALYSYEQALKYRKNYAICHYNMGNLYLDQKRYSEAMLHWHEAVALNPRQPKAWANILTMLDSRGLFEDALRLSTQALEHLPHDTNIMFIRANVYGKLRQYVEAETLYKKVISYEPLNVMYHTNLGVLYHHWGKTHDAIESYKRAVEVDPGKSSKARENLGKLLKRLRKQE